MAKPQSTFLCFDKNNANAQKYFTRRYEHYFNPLLELFPELERAFKCSDERYFMAPLTLIHDDLLPINVLLSDDGVHFIWESVS